MSLWEALERASWIHLAAFSMGMLVWLLVGAAAAVGLVELAGEALAWWRQRGRS